MKKYILIKEYPGSPKLGTIVEGKFLGHYHDISMQTTSITSNSVENYSEFWEEVVEKDYEILSYIGKSTKNVLSAKLDPFVNNKLIEWEDKNLDIHSVKRVSDGEVFTIGDFVNGRTISSFSINWMKIGFKVHCDDVGKGNINDGCFFELQDLKTTKSPLFTTEDGVDIFESDKIYSIESSLNEVDEKIAGIYKHSNTNHPVEHWYKDDKYFSTKEKAEEYILNNKPCLSLKDIITTLDLDNITIKRITKITKTKIKTIK